MAANEAEDPVVPFSQSPSWWFQTIVAKHDEIIQAECPLDPKQLAETMGVPDSTLTSESDTTTLDSMMVQALNKAVSDYRGMKEVEKTRESLIKSLWGDTENRPLTNVVMEASTLFRVNKWLRQNEDSLTLEKKTALLQELLNTLVTSVLLHGIMDPDAATRSTYAIACLLKLHLGKVEERTLPAGVILSGMQNRTTSAQVLDALSQYEKVKKAGVALQKGFAFVRFMTTDGAKAVWDNFVISEIVVDDVAVMVKLLNLPASQEPLWFDATSTQLD